MTFHLYSRQPPALETHCVNKTGYSCVEILIGEQHVVDEAETSGSIPTIIPSHYLP